MEEAIAKNGEVIEILPQFTEKERHLITTAIVEAEVANTEFQQAQEVLRGAQALLQTKKEELNYKVRISKRTYETIMILKNINPDAYELSWDGTTEEVNLKIKKKIEAEKIQ